MLVADEIEWELRWERLMAWLRKAFRRLRRLMKIRPGGSESK